MQLDFTCLLQDLIIEQRLGLEVKDLSLIVQTENNIFTFARIIYEDDQYITIIVESPEGAEFGKILNKDKIECVEILYAQMLEKPTQNKEDGMYG